MSIEGQPKPVVDSAELEAKVQEFLALETRDPIDFADALADNILAPIPAEVAAFRDTRLAFKSLVAAEFLIANTNSVLKRRRKGSEESRRTEYFRNAVGRERRVLENIVNGERAKRGVLPNQPNPRRRAERRLVALNLKGDVPKGMFRQLFEEEKAADAERKRLEKERRRQMRREARRGQGPGSRG